MRSVWISYLNYHQSSREGKWHLMNVCLSFMFIIIANVHVVHEFGTLPCDNERKFREYTICRLLLTIEWWAKVACHTIPFLIVMNVVNYSNVMRELGVMTSQRQAFLHSNPQKMSKMAIFADFPCEVENTLGTKLSRNLLLCLDETTLMYI